MGSGPNDTGGRRGGSSGATSSLRRLPGLLSIQRAGGGFDLDRETAAALGLDWTAFEPACKNVPGPREEVLRALGTAVALEVLARRFGGRKAEWAAPRRGIGPEDW
jgi:hypothetical protein